MQNGTFISAGKLRNLGCAMCKKAHIFQQGYIYFNENQRNLGCTTYKIANYFNWNAEKCWLSCAKNGLSIITGMQRNLGCHMQNGAFISTGMHMFQLGCICFNWDAEKKNN